MSLCCSVGDETLFFRDGHGDTIKIKVVCTDLEAILYVFLGS